VCTHSRTYHLLPREREEILHTHTKRPGILVGKFFHPTVDYWGTSVVSPAKRAINAVNDGAVAVDC